MAAGRGGGTGSGFAPCGAAVPPSVLLLRPAAGEMVAVEGRAGPDLFHAVYIDECKAIAANASFLAARCCMPAAAWETGRWTLAGGMA
jgi:hypothetical protein